MDSDGLGEVFRLNLEVGRFMRSYAVEVGGDDFTSAGGGALQGGIRTGAVNTAAIADNSHSLLAFGTSLGTVEFWDPRARTAVGVLPPPTTPDSFEGRPESTCLEFDHSGLTMASGLSNGLIHLYDLRSPVPFLKKDHGYGYPIHTLTFLASSSDSSRTAHLASEPKILSSDKRIIKIWDAQNGSPWTSVEPAVDLNCVTWNKDSGMILTANEGRQQHSFFIPQLGPAPKWCSFLDNLVEEMAEGGDDPAAFGGSRKVGEVYDNYKFLTVPQLRSLNLDHLVGTTGLLRPYMHGYFVAQQLYEEARLISNPETWQEARQKTIRDKIDKERESRIRGNKKVAVKVNKRLAERMLEREEKNERRKAKRAIEKGAAAQEDDDATQTQTQAPDTDMPDARPANESTEAERATALTDPRFAALFQQETFAIDEESHEFRALNASSLPLHQNGQNGHHAPSRSSDPSKRLTAAELEDLSDRERHGSSSASDLDSDGESEPETGVGRRQDRTAHAYADASTNGNGDGSKIQAASYKRNKSGVPSRAKPQKEKIQKPPKEPQMQISSSDPRVREARAGRDQTFGARAAEIPRGEGGRGAGARRENVVGERAVTFVVGEGKDKEKNGGKGFGRDREGGGGGDDRGAKGRRGKDRRSASNNVFRRM